MKLTYFKPGIEHDDGNYESLPYYALFIAEDFSACYWSYSFIFCVRALSCISVRVVENHPENLSPMVRGLYADLDNWLLIKVFFWFIDIQTT